MKIRKICLFSQEKTGSCGEPRLPISRRTWHIQRDVLSWAQGHCKGALKDETNDHSEFISKVTHDYATVSLLISSDYN